MAGLFFPLEAESETRETTYWKTLHYFGLYRVCLALILFSTSLFIFPLLPGVTQESIHAHLPLTLFYFIANLVSLGVMYFYRQRFNMQLSLAILVDVFILTLLMDSEIGLRSNFVVLFFVMLAGAGLVGQGRLVLFYAALASLAILLDQTHRAITRDIPVGDFFQVGLLCIGFFGVAISARLLAARVVANQSLARQRGIDLKNQMLINQRIIEEMQDGVVVLTGAGEIRQYNPRAQELLALKTNIERISECSSELHQHFVVWKLAEDNTPILLKTPINHLAIRVRFLSTESLSGDVLMLVEDLSHLQEKAQQLKLAALGKLTANIAHEIRNPLSSIQHAGELLAESVHDPLHTRLVKIIGDNAKRLERIISDILATGRRNRIHREPIDLSVMLTAFVDEYIFKENIDEDIIQLVISPHATAFLFDRSHLHQILWNLVSNAFRYCRRNKGSLKIYTALSSMSGWIELHVLDDGAGIDIAHWESVFEPFFTTESEGTGLGLYIAQGLCEANGARLELRKSREGAHFCILGRQEA